MSYGPNSAVSLSIVFVPIALLFAFVLYKVPYRPPDYGRISRNMPTPSFTTSSTTSPIKNLIPSLTPNLIEESRSIERTRSKEGGSSRKRHKLYKNKSKNNKSKKYN